MESMKQAAPAKERDNQAPSASHGEGGSPAGTAAASLVQLQRLAGNAAVASSLRASPQTSGGTGPTASGPAYDVTAANDPLEGEADAVAGAVTDSAVDRPIRVSRSSRRATRSINPAASGPVGPEGGALDQQTSRRIDDRRGRGSRLPGPFRRRTEAALGTDLGHVGVHRDDESDRLSRQLSARAFAVGSDVFVRKGEPQAGTAAGDRLLAHEVTHVVQQGPISRLIHRNYLGLTTMGKARVDQRAQQDYAEQSQKFELEMGRRIQKDERANVVVDDLLGTLKKIVDSWATHTGKQQSEVYQREFSWSGGDSYYGAFEMTGANITKVFGNLKGSPMRTKLKIFYNAVRNNNLQKWLKVAALELDREAKKKKAKTRKIKTSQGGTSIGKWIGNIFKRDRWKTESLEKEEVTTGFGKDSGLQDLWKGTDLSSKFATEARQERETTGWRSKRDVFGHDRQSKIANWSQLVSGAHRERVGGGNTGIDVSKQRTLNRGDVDDLTDEEAIHLLKRQTGKDPTPEELQRFKSDPQSKVGWEQGGEYYEVIPGTATDKEANDIGMRLEAGVSGSTDLMLHAVENLGIKDPQVLKSLRLALAGWMMANRDHSFFEIYKAATAYGVDWNPGDQGKPGSAYEKPENLVPMEPKDFADILKGPDGANVFPSYFLSVPYKDHLAVGLASGDKQAQAYRDELARYRISQTDLNRLNEAELADVTALAEDVKKAEIPAGGSLSERRYALRRLRLLPSYTRLVRSQSQLAPAILKALIGAHHSVKGLFDMSQAAPAEQLADCGVPRFMLDTIGPNDVKALLGVAWAMAAVRPTAKTPEERSTQIGQAVSGAWAAVRRELANSRLGHMAWASLARHFHGDASLTREQRLLAQAARTMSGPDQDARLSEAELKTMAPPEELFGQNESQVNKKRKTDDYWGIGKAENRLAQGSNATLQLLQYNYNKMSPGDKAAFVQKIAQNYPKGQMVGDVLSEEYGALYDQANPKRLTLVPEALGVLQGLIPPADFEALLPEQSSKSLAGLRGLDPKELGAIVRYTEALYKPLVQASNSMETGLDFKTEKKTDWGSNLRTLEYSGPILAALSSGLAKLPVYTGSVFRVSASNQNLIGQSEAVRQNYLAQNYPRGALQSQRYPMSTAKTLESQFIKTNYAAMDVVWEITNIKSGRDIQVISDKFGEEEVLFQPGSRLVVSEVFTQNPYKPDDKHIWIRMQER
jgi:hypothetical protein